jgi:hypothetical protein
MRMMKLETAVAISALLAVATAQTPANSPATNQSTSVAGATMPAECAAWVPKPALVSSIRDVKRIFVDSFGEDPVSLQIHAMVVSQLLQSARFVVTENRQKADAFLKGAGVEKTSVESHSYNSGTAASHAAGGHSSSVSGSMVNGTGSISGSSSGGFAAAGAAINDSYSSTQAVNDARVSVRLVNQDGDVIWAATHESKGAKYKGASADVADKVVKQLMRDLEKSEKKPVSSETASVN